MAYKSPIRVAFADDHDVVRQGICGLLSTSSRIAVVIEANNGQQLLDELERADKLLDVCILDIFMPKLDGYATLIEIKKRWPELKVLVLTGHNTEYYLIRMIRAGASGYLLKNCASNEVESAIVAVHEKGRYFSASIDAKIANQALKHEVDTPELSDKELLVLRYCCSDLSYVQIAEKLNMTPKSVEHWREGLFKKLHVASRSGLVVMAIQLGLAELENNTVTTDSSITHTNTPLNS